MQHFRSIPISYITLLLILLAASAARLRQSPGKAAVGEPFDAPEHGTSVRCRCHGSH